MKKHAGTLYRSAWDAGTWFIIILTAVLCAWPLFMDDGLIPALICLLCFAFVFITLASIRYRIDGDKLVVYALFVPTAYPIEKIARICPSKTLLSSPAAALTERIAIHFKDKSVLRSTMPLVISPVRRAQFIEQLKAINPNIEVLDNAPQR